MSLGTAMGACKFIAEAFENTLEAAKEKVGVLQLDNEFI